MLDEDQFADDEVEAIEPSEGDTSMGLYSRFTPWELDRMASELLGERPLCERWISRDGKRALLWGLTLSRAKPEPGYKGATPADLVELWKKKFQK